MSSLRQLSHPNKTFQHVYRLHNENKVAIVFKAEATRLSPRVSPSPILLHRLSVLPSCQPGLQIFAPTMLLLSWPLHMLLSSYLGYVIPTHSPDLREAFSDHREDTKSPLL